MQGKPALLIVDHGSRREAANQALHELADRVQALLGEQWIVRGAHMEIAAPSIAEGFADCVAAGATTVIVHPYMLSPGRHAAEDIPRLAAVAAETHNVAHRLTDPVGSSDAMAGLVADIARGGLEPAR